MKMVKRGKVDVIKWMYYIMNWFIFVYDDKLIVEVILYGFFYWVGWVKCNYDIFYYLEKKIIRYGWVICDSNSIVLEWIWVNLKVD